MTKVEVQTISHSQTILYLRYVYQQRGYFGWEVPIQLDSNFGIQGA